MWTPRLPFASIAAMLGEFMRQFSLARGVFTWGRARSEFLAGLLGGTILCGLACPRAQAAETQGPVSLGDRLELFVDDWLVQRIEGARFTLHAPVPAGVVLRFDEPWEGAFCAYGTVIKDGEVFRLYYRGLPSAGKNSGAKEVTCYAESRDGIAWVKPRLGLFEVCGTRSNNVVLADLPPFSGNFAPFLDARPGVPAAERFKALAGSEKTGLVAFISADGIHWRKIRETPVLTRGVFDSQNVAFWSPSENCYAAYFRTWTEGLYKGYRSISRSTSTNFLDWTAPVQMSFGNAPAEHLYTSQTHPYFRAPHIYLATPMRFVPNRTALSAEQARLLGVAQGYAGDATDVVLMASRGGDRYSRLFMEGFIRPGPDPGNWSSRAGLAVLGFVPTGPGEISIYKQAHYAQPTAHLLRYTLRTDGFASVNAPYSGGEILTKPLTFSGRELVLNFATSAAGSIKVEIQAPSGAALPGHTLAEARELIGDDLERVVSWQKGADLGALAGQAVRLRFVMKDADLYSMRFRQ